MVSGSGEGSKGEETVLLASASPRRFELLQQIGVQCLVITVNVVELRAAQETAENYVKRLALDKARAGKIAAMKSDELKDLPVIGADTTVVLEDSPLDSQVLEKPQDKKDAIKMLSLLAGRTHTVMSAVAMVGGDKESVKINKTRVTFRPIIEAEMAAYWETGEPADKAGAYGIQGLGGVFVEKIEGSYSGVMGLPLWETCELLSYFNVPYWYAG
ncbi:MAG: septum formation inhibitor Maf [Pseudomonadales bacterium]|nr:septum formation inhibitor Maf [Pseudomonadales bacterium]